MPDGNPLKALFGRSLAIWVQPPAGRTGVNCGTVLAAVCQAGIDVDCDWLPNSKMTESEAVLPILLE